MVGYGVTNNSDDQSKNFNSTLPTSLSEDFTKKTKPAPKKELTLQEKQKLASQFENNTSTKNEMSNSYSMQGINHNQKPSNSDLLSDNLMNSNLASLSFSNSTSQQNGKQNILPITNAPHTCK